MGRWKPGSADRLQQAAIDLFTEKGFDATTVAGIAERAGVTERTFFRHFADKREVLFAGQEHLQHVFVEAVTDAPADTPAMSLAARALDAGAAALQETRGQDYPRARNAIITANRALRERELLKMAALSRAVTEAMAARGIADLSARLAGDLVASVFAAAFERWVAPGETRDLATLQRASLDELSRLAQDG
ncbi:TetR/AcrR family transcriptional regulator [Myceligenerans cantabricum]